MSKPVSVEDEVINILTLHHTAGRIPEILKSQTDELLSLITRETTKARLDELEHVRELQDYWKFIGEYGDELVTTSVLIDRINQLQSTLKEDK